MWFLGWRGYVTKPSSNRIQKIHRQNAGKSGNSFLALWNGKPTEFLLRAYAFPSWSCVGSRMWMAKAVLSVSRNTIYPCFLWVFLTIRYFHPAFTILTTKLRQDTRRNVRCWTTLTSRVHRLWVVLTVTNGPKSNNRTFIITSLHRNPWSLFWSCSLSGHLLRGFIRMYIMSIHFLTFLDTEDWCKLII
jgi:hypothetical protein